MTSTSVFAKIPLDRIGALIGRDACVKEKVETLCSVKLQIDSETGNIVIALTDKRNPSFLFTAKEIIVAIGRGFSPDRAFQLLDKDDAVLDVIDLREIVGRSRSDISRLKGRVIGKDGKTRKTIEELTGATISVYGHTISIIGSVSEAEVAREAIQMLIKGRQHGTVYRYLHGKRRELKKKKMDPWLPKELKIGHT